MQSDSNLKFKWYPRSLFLERFGSSISIKIKYQGEAEEKESLKSVRIVTMFIEEGGEFDRGPSIADLFVLCSVF